MRGFRAFAGLSLLSALGQACSPPKTIGVNTAAPYLNASGPNVLQVSVAPTSVCSQAGYENEPCTSITLCMPGTSQCQNVGDILIDTGSSGLRIFPSTLGFSLQPQTDALGRTIAECVQYGIGSDWGPVAIAEVGLGGEPHVTIPIQLIDKGFAHVPAGCSDADADPAHAGFNGILGMGLFAQDCGLECARKPSNQTYYSCDSSGACTNVAMPLSQQLQNPVSELPVDNNGLLLAFSQVDLSGSRNANGVLILGIGTQENNGPIGVSANATDPSGNFTTQFNGNSYSFSFIDSGSNGLYFPNTMNLAKCGGNQSGFYCPGGIQDYSAVTISTTGEQAKISFQIANAGQLVSSGNVAFNDLGGDANGLGGFDWGMPFFFGRAVFVGLEGKSSPLGNGTFWAY